VLGGIGAISLLVGGIGILNIMLVSVTERTREIGLRKALGAKKGTILQQFLIEAVVLTLVGGLMGLGAAIGVLYLAVALVPFLDKVVLSPFTVLLGLFVSVATGVVFGVWPASRAANLSPIEALRYE
jgi:putative ABC transport system permease protein